MLAKTIHPSLRRAAGLFASSIDECTGRNVLTFSTGSDTAAIRKALESLSVARDMVDLESTTQPTGAGTPQEWYRPMVGGLEIWSPTTGNTCTVGCNVLNWETGLSPSTSPKYFLTAGHCSGTLGEPANSRWTQGGHHIGYEYQAAPILKDDAVNCPPADKYGNIPWCMYADVMVVQYADTVNWYYGRVATLLMPSRIIHNTLNVQPPLIVNGGLLNQNVYLVAPQTGQHNNGRIERTCDDVFYVDRNTGLNTPYIMCTQRTNNKMKFPRFSGHLQRLDQDSRQEVRSEETRTEGV